MASYPAAGQANRRRNCQPNPLRTATTVAAAAVAAYGTYRLASWAWNSYWEDDDEEENEEETSACVENSQQRRQRQRQQQQQQREEELDRDLHGDRYGDVGNKQGGSAAANDPRARHLRRLARQHRIRRCRDETTSALTDFLPTLRDTIASATDFTSETSELKRIRSARAARMRRRAERDALTGGGSLHDTEMALEKDAEGQDRIPTPQHELLKKEEEDDLMEERRERLKESELWEAIKVKSVTRLVATAYGHSILLLVLTVQVHLLGGRLFREEEEEEEAEAARKEKNNKGDDAEKEIEVPAAADAFSTASSLGLMSRTGPDNKSTGGGDGSHNSTTSYQSTHRTVLTKTYGHLFSAGMSSLIRTVESAVTSAFEGHDVTDPESMNITSAQFNEAIDAVRSAVEGRRGGSRGGRAALVRYVVQPGGSDAANVIGSGMGGGDGDPAVSLDPVAVHILEETWDVLESPTFEAAERDVLDLTYGMMREGGWGGIFPPAGVAAAAVAVAGATPVEINAPTRPLAQVVTQLRRTVNTFYSDMGGGTSAATANMYLSALERLPTTVELGDVGFN